MSRISSVFKDLREKGEKALIPYVCCGDPQLEFTERLVPLLAENGADMIELGMPYSDPIADGPTIQRAAVRALRGGVNLKGIFAVAERVRAKVTIPLILMTYYNPIYVTGLNKFIARAASAGIDGLVVPDLPVEESGQLREAAERKGMELILLVAPTSTDERIKRIAALSRGFIYCVSVTGVTGSRRSIDSGLEKFIKRVRVHTELPLAVGFGISGPETARRAAEHADGVIVGSAFIEHIEESIADESPEDALEKAAAFVRSIKKELKKQEGKKTDGAN